MNFPDRLRAAATAAVLTVFLVAGPASRADEAVKGKDDDVKSLAESVATATSERDAWNDAVKLLSYK